jgi:alpha-tubulin suppressor-like RCC1 family protein
MVLAGLRPVALLWTATAVAACSNEFPNAPNSAITIEAIGWPAELHHTDADTVEVRIRQRDSQQEITGLRLRWISSDDAVLTVVPLDPNSPGSLEDTLVAQRRAVVTARSTGHATVHVVVTPPGFDAADSSIDVSITQKWRAVSAGRAHTCAINVDSVAYCWGEGTNGKLGNARPITSFRPSQVVGLGDFKFIAVSAGDESSCGIIREHVAFCWGSNAEGRLGNGDASERSQFVPTPVSGPGFDAVDVGRALCGLGQNALAYCWGSNVERQLGHYGLQPPPLDMCLDSNPAGCSRAPRQVSPRPGAPTSYRGVVVGGHHACGISQTPASFLAFCWGTGPFGALGNASVTTSDTTVPVSGGLTFKVLAAGGDHTCGITTGGITYCWGANATGQLGHGATGDAMTPGLTTTGSFDSLTAGGQHTCALTNQGVAYCWGLGSSGQLGNDSTSVQRFPVTVSGGQRFAAVSAGAFHTCGVTSDGSLYCWGRGAEGQLGAGASDLTNHSSPNRVVEP